MDLKLELFHLVRDALGKSMVGDLESGVITEVIAMRLRSADPYHITVRAVDGEQRNRIRFFTFVLIENKTP